jgi:hypothetical protein
VVRGVAQVRPHYESPVGDLLRVVLNATSVAEANLALGILSGQVPEKDLIGAVNLREQLIELPVCPFPMAVDVETLARIEGLEKDRSAWRRRFEDSAGDYDIVILGDGNLCYDIVIHADGKHVFWTPQPHDEEIIHPEALDLALGRDRLLQALVTLVKSMGLPFAPKFYLSLEDWSLQYAEDMMADLGGLF